MKTVSRSSEKHRKELTLLLSREQAATAGNECRDLWENEMYCCLFNLLLWLHTPKWVQHCRKRLHQTNITSSKRIEIGVFFLSPFTHSPKNVNARKRETSWNLCFFNCHRKVHSSCFYLSHLNCSIYLSLFRVELKIENVFTYLLFAPMMAGESSSNTKTTFTRTDQIRIKMRWFVFLINRPASNEHMRANTQNVHNEPNAQC